MSNGDPRERKTWWLSVTALGCLGLFIVFFDLNGYRTLTKHEGFVAVVSREMLQSGDWVVPRFGGLPRLKKPPLAYWCAAGTSAIFGEHAPWTARFPFAVSALLLAGLVGVWAGKWYGRWAGLAAALVQISCIYVISFARKAEVDMLLCLLTTSALFLVAGAPLHENRRKTAFRWIAIYALLGLAWLAKFHYGPAMVLGVVGVWLVVDRRRPGLWDVFNPLGLLILVAALVIWPWLLLQRVPEAWEIWQAETVGRALGALGREPIWFYVPQVFLLALPWSVLLGKAGKTSFQKAWQEGDRRERFLWVWFITQFAILSASAFKHHHYLMAAMPAVSLILGREVAAFWTDLRSGKILFKKSHVVALAVGFVVLGVGAAIGVSLRWPHLSDAAVNLGIGIAVSGLITSFCLARRRWSQTLTAAGFGFAICYAIVTAVIFPNRDSRQAAVEFASRLRNVVPAERPVCVYGLKEDPLVYYLEGPVFRVESSEILSKHLERRGALALITDRAHLRELQELQELPYRIEDSPASDAARKPRSEFLLVKITPTAIASAPSPSKKTPKPSEPTKSE